MLFVHPESRYVRYHEVSTALGARIPVAVECCIDQINKLLMHFGCPSNLGLKMKVSMERLIVELGVSRQPLQESYKRYSSRVTHCWLTSLWEKCDVLNIKVEFLDTILRLPRIMLEFARPGYNLPTLLRLNRVRLHQQVIFLSCVLGASGKELDEKTFTSALPIKSGQLSAFPRKNHPVRTFVFGNRLFVNSCQPANSGSTRGLSV